MFHQTVILTTNRPDPQLTDIVPAVAEMLATDFAWHISNPDIKEIRRSKSSIGIAEIQPLISWNAVKPFQGEHKLGIIFEADRLTPEAQNSLLKTLEEPAPGTLICLVTRNRNALLTTILSRSQHINLDNFGARRVENATEIESLAVKFLQSDLLQRQQIVAKLAEMEEAREASMAFVSAMMRLLVSGSGGSATSQLNSALDICKQAYLGLKAGTNIKLTLETILISMS